MSKLTLRVVTYNVLAQCYIKPERYPLCDPADLDATTRQGRLINKIKSLDADAYALQEVEASLVSALQEAMPGYQIIWAQRPNKQEGCAIMARRGLITDHQTLHFKKRYERKAYLALMATLHVDGQPVSIASTHLAWQPESTRSAAHAGRAQLQELIDAMGGFSDAPWLIAGDFNANSESCVIELAHERGFMISCRRQRPWDTVNINRKRRKIDYILANVRQWEAEPGTLPQLGRDEPMPSAIHASDHLPLEIRFTLR